MTIDLKAICAAVDSKEAASLPLLADWCEENGLANFGKIVPWDTCFGLSWATDYWPSSILLNPPVSGIFLPAWRRRHAGEQRSGWIFDLPSHLFDRLRMVRCYWKNRSHPRDVPHYVLSFPQEADAATYTSMSAAYISLSIALTDRDIPRDLLQVIRGVVFTSDR